MDFTNNKYLTKAKNNAEKENYLKNKALKALVDGGFVVRKSQSVISTKII